jgi:hypothetical protein
MNEIYAIVVKGQPFILGIVVLYVAIRAILDMYKKIVDIKSVEDNRFLRLVNFKKNLKPKEMDLNKFLDKRITEEVFTQSTGLYCASEKNKKIVQFYNENTSIITWKEVRKVASNFKLEKDKLTFTERGLTYKIITVITYSFYGLIALISWFVIIYGLSEHRVTIGLGLQLLLLFCISLWMILHRMNETYLRKKFEDMEIEF